MRCRTLTAHRRRGGTCGPLSHALQVSPAQRGRPAPWELSPPPTGRLSALAAVPDPEVAREALTEASRSAQGAVTAAEVAQERLAVVAERIPDRGDVPGEATGYGGPPVRTESIDGGGGGGGSPYGGDTDD